jgi:hypothetical protein
MKVRAALTADRRERQSQASRATSVSAQRERMFRSHALVLGRFQPSPGSIPSRRPAYLELLAPGSSLGHVLSGVVQPLFISRNNFDLVAVRSS